MAFGPPPENYRGTPNRHELAPGTRLWRVQSDEFGPLDFNPKPADRYWGGGRFDCTADCWYPYLYAAPADETALAEVLLRNLPFPGNGRKRTLQRQQIENRYLLGLELRRKLTLISLVTTPDLAAIRQEDGWLVDANGQEYAFTRKWAHWLREVAPWAQGLIWASRRNLGKPAVALFGDRGTTGSLALVNQEFRPLDDKEGARFLNEKLAPFHVRVCPPRAPKAEPGSGNGRSAPASEDIHGVL